MYMHGLCQSNRQCPVCRLSITEVAARKKLHLEHLVLRKAPGRYRSAAPDDADDAKERLLCHSFAAVPHPGSAR